MITYITESEVKSNLKMGECIEELRKAFISYGKGMSDTHSRDRIMKNNNILNTMPGFYADRHLAGLKTYYSGPSGIHFVVLTLNVSLLPLTLYNVELICSTVIFPLLAKIVILIPDDGIL